jgi:hypothetical protein
MWGRKRKKKDWVFGEKDDGWFVCKTEKVVNK